MIKSWMVIGGVAIGLAIALGGLSTGRGSRWFRRLRRPSWLTFERAIPLIWITIFICGAWSAYIVWEQNPGTPQTWWLMAFYLVLEIVTLAYTPMMLWLRRINAGVVIGGTGFLIAIGLALTVFPVSQLAMFLLIPYLLWSPIGTYTTWAMSQLNPLDQ